jgi:Flp pilus assembly protein TadD
MNKARPVAGPHAAARLLLPMALVVLALATPPMATSAADDPAPAARPASDPLGAARKLIADKNWAGAIDELKRVNATRSADWNNLMGYSHRKARTPDLAAADRYYEAALRIDANHRGALEYSGELALMQGDLPKAEQRRAALEKACGGRCEELDDLKGAIARYKANGNKHVPRD